MKAFAAEPVEVDPVLPIDCHRAVSFECHNQLLGAGYRDRVRAYASTLFRPTPEAMAQAARGYVARGFTAVKFGWGVFGRDPGRDVELVAAAREAVGDRVELMVDAGWLVRRTSKEAAAMVRRLEPYRPYFGATRRICGQSAFAQ